MKEKIVIRNILRSQKPDAAYKGVRIGFDFASDKAIANNSNYKGIAENACWYDDLSLFDKLPVEIINKPVDATFKTIQNSRNPMKSISTIETIFYNGSNIRLL